MFPRFVVVLLASPCGFIGDCSNRNNLNIAEGHVSVFGVEDLSSRSLGNVTMHRVIGRKTIKFSLKFFVLPKSLSPDGDSFIQ
jgi:hypothetical protein